ncbi:MAG: pyridoxamine 5'-phosphate oxidase family protein [Chloroflexi bacterium]|nr:pyridoxamine 5'-phosphate oxidase family protein [Chloroflexota bacterium]
MTGLSRTAPAFVEMAHRIVWSSVATVDRAGRPRSRLLHPIWTWDGVALVGWIGTTATPVKLAHLEQSPFVSCSYWAPSHDHCVAECRADWAFDDETRTMVWNLFKDAPAPLGYDPAAIGAPGWDSPTAPAFAVLRLRPWRPRVFPGSIVRGAGGELLTWQE